MKKIKIALLFSFILAPSIVPAAPGEREWRIVIEKNYKRSKKIWGTYGQTSEKTRLDKKRSVSVKRNLAANMMLKNGKMILIQPVTITGLTSYKVKEFPYKKKRGKRYQVALKEGKKEFLDIHKEQLIAVLRENKIDPNEVDWKSLQVDKMSCKSKRRNFNCQIPLVIKRKPNS